MPSPCRNDAMDERAYAPGFAVDLARKDLSLADLALSPRRSCALSSIDWTTPSPTATATTIWPRQTTNESNPLGTGDSHVRRRPRTIRHRRSDHRRQRGIGAATARLLLEAGAKVAVQARRRDRLEELVDKYGADNVLVVTGDVQKPDSATELISQTVTRFGRLDSIVVNAGLECTGDPRRHRR